MKKDFFKFMVRLQHSCNHCCVLMVYGNRWVCNQCANFQLCDRCHVAEQKLDSKKRHPINQEGEHTLYPVEIIDLPDYITNKNEIIKDGGFSLSFETIETTCNICHLDIESDQGWRCETCLDYDVCNSCIQKDGGIDHPHKLVDHSSMDFCARILQFQRWLEVVLHASQCRTPHCQYHNCLKVRYLYLHWLQCRIRASGGCVLCKKMWCILQLHARSCKESECYVPQCRDLKERLLKIMNQR